MDNKVTKRRIAINKISIDAEVIPREQLNKDHVNNLLQDLKEGAELPPVDLFFDGKRYFLADGHHRHEAFIKAGHKTIEAVIHKGDKRDAFFFSCGANAKHGLPLTKPDKHKVVDRLLRDAEWRAFSNGIIAEHCAVSPQFVGKLRRELTRNGFESPSKRMGKDRRTIDTDKIGKNSGDPMSREPVDPKKESIPVVIKVDKNSLPPKGKGKSKKQNGGTDDEDGQDKPNPTPDSSVIIGGTKKLIHDLQDGLRAFDELLPNESKIQKTKEKDLYEQYKRLIPLWSNFVKNAAMNFDWDF